MEVNTSQKSGARKKRGRKRGPWKIIFILAALAVLLSIGGCSALYVAGNQMIDMKKLDLMQGSTVYANDGKTVVGKLERDKRENISFDKIPKNIVNAFIATEDSRFYEHNGVDPIGIARAIFKDITTGSKAEGASTITQQLARNVFLTNDKTFMRKTKEIMIALNLERQFSKEQILEMYLNRFYAGHGVFGIQAASQYYFGTSVDKLSLAQAATLAALPKAPNNYSPDDHHDAALQRRNLVLSLMLKNGYITSEQMQQAQAEPLTVVQSKPKNTAAYQAYMDYVAKEAETKLGIPGDQLYQGGYKIYTYLDPKTQDIMYKEYQDANNFPEGGPAHDRKVQSAMVVMEAKTGGITALVGGRDYVAKGLNRADVPRQPGSAIKPLVDYAPALEEGWTPDSTVDDDQKSYNGWTPKNFGNEGYGGPMTMYKAIVDSRNAAAVWTLNKIGIDKGVSYLKKFGIPVRPDEESNLAIAIGGMDYGATPIQMAQAYTAFPNNGNMSIGHAIKKITTQDDNLVVQGDKDPTPVVSPKTAYYMTQMLQGVVQEGTGRSARFDHPVAGKTGTHQDKDVWFVGYTPDYVASVWMGFDKTDDQHHLSTTGGAYPAKMFRKVMSQALQGTPINDFTKPDGVDNTPPPVQQNQTPAASGLSAVVEGSSVKLSWTGSGGSDMMYRVFKFMGSPANKQLVAETGSTSYTDSYDPNQLYSYVVVPYNKATGQEGTMSNMAVTTVPNQPNPGTVNPNNPNNPNGGNQTGGTNPNDNNSGNNPNGNGGAPNPNGNTDGSNTGGNSPNGTNSGGNTGGTGGTGTTGSNTGTTNGNPGSTNSGTVTQPGTSIGNSSGKHHHKSPQPGGIVQQQDLTGTNQ
ncbi:transglycosylase domain-containing protein [Aneurinibacillus terranovensis]|uniref:transglycosylase domain-containing protein n=1 Tax=Aneurinibacillus terranovensis TaxID=278991 RepID=UPI0004198A28|nr:PBP1A family penicillin-binding protein [Aneurinibacillus terranovensis]